MTWIDDQQFELCTEDCRMLDRLVESGFDVEQLEPLSDEERERAHALENLFGLMEHYPVEDAQDTLLHATLARIDRDEDERADRMSIETGAVRSRISFPDFITVAAMVLIMASVACHQPVPISEN